MDQGIWSSTSGMIDKEDSRYEIIEKAFEAAFSEEDEDEDDR